MKDEERVREVQHLIANHRVKPGQVWRHNKTASFYEIVSLSVDEETLRPLVTYRSISKGFTWTRALDVFLGPSGDDGEPRFGQADPGEAHYANDRGVRCSSCGSANLEPRGMGSEIFYRVCATCGANPA